MIQLRIVRLADHRCRYCGAIATWQSKVSYWWLCDTCRPCWCDFCRGRAGVHGEEAVALYNAKIAACRQGPGA